MKRLIRDSIRLGRRREELPPERFAARRQRLQGRLRELLGQPWEQRHARRLVKRLRRHEAELFTFLDHAGVPSDNNHAERQIRPAVMARKNSYANGSGEGAETQSVLTNVFRTLKQRGHNPVSAVLDGGRAYLRTGQLPPLPDRFTELGWSVTHPDFDPTAFYPTTFGIRGPHPASLYVAPHIDPAPTPAPGTQVRTFPSGPRRRFQPSKWLDRLILQR